MSRYKVTLQCAACGNKWSKVVSDADKVMKRPPKCPNLDCRAVQYERGIDLTQNRAPGIVGASNITKAVDLTAETVMNNYGMTNLKDNIREGESMVPRLPAQQQAIADGFFGGQAVKERVGARNRKQMDIIGRRAIAGAYRNMSLDVKGVLPDQSVALRSVGQIERPK